MRALAVVCIILSALVGAAGVLVGGTIANVVWIFATALLLAIWSRIFQASAQHEDHIKAILATGEATKKLIELQKPPAVATAAVAAVVATPTATPTDIPAVSTEPNPKLEKLNP